jgi:mono/diheme cytochrome c family protein
MWAHLLRLTSAITVVSALGVTSLYMNRSENASSGAQNGLDALLEPKMHSFVATASAQEQDFAGLETPQAVQTGAQLFRENCAQCHGAPGVAATIQGMKPAPPNLLGASRKNIPPDVFSKIKNGIPGTAMPAWGSSMPDQSIWSLAAFLHHSRGISPTEFSALSTSKTGDREEAP